MTVHVPHLPRPGSVLATTALTCALCAAPTTAALGAAARSHPALEGLSAEAGHVDRARSPPSARSARRCPPRRRRTRARRSRGVLPHPGAPLAVAVVSYVALGFLAVVGRRRGDAARACVVGARPVTCEISLVAGRAAAMRSSHRAARRRRGAGRGANRGASNAGRRSRRDDDAASHEAYDELLRELYADGWQPYERGRDGGRCACARRRPRSADAGATWLSAVSPAASLVRGGAALAAGGAALAVWPRTTVSAPSAKQDAEILRFALTVEDLQAAFYADALKQRRAAAASCSSSRGRSAATNAPMPRTSASSWARARRSPRPSTSATPTPRPSGFARRGDRARGARAGRLQRSGRRA